MPAPSVGSRLLPRIHRRTWTCDERGSLVSFYHPIRFVREVIVLDWLGFAIAVAVPWFHVRMIT
jgi:hypothetical protein